MSDLWGFGVGEVDLSPVLSIPVLRCGSRLVFGAVSAVVGSALRPFRLGACCSRARERVSWAPATHASVRSCSALGCAFEKNNNRNPSRG